MLESIIDIVTMIINMMVSLIMCKQFSQTW